MEHERGVDPGWSSAVRSGLLLFVKGAFILGGRSITEGPAIVVLRRLFVTFAFAQFLFVFVLALIFGELAVGSPMPVTYLMIAVGLIAVAVVVPRLEGRITAHVTPGSTANLLGEYQAQLFLQIAFAESAALLGFVSAFLTEAIWPYLVGMALSMVGFARLAPTAGRLRKLDQLLARAGYAGSLQADLLTLPMQPPTWRRG